MKKLLILLLLVCSISIHAFDVKIAQKLTYRLDVQTVDGIKGLGTAVAISSDGKLITAYHNVDSAKSVVVVDYKGNQHNVTIGEISVEHDLAYLYIEAKEISFAKLSTTTPKLADDIHVLSYDNLLLKGIVSKVEENGVIINVEISKGTSGGGIFNSKNELVAVALNKDMLDNTSFGATVNVFKSIIDKYKPLQLQKSSSNNYDHSYCQNEDDLAVWSKHAKSSNLNIQEYHALFLGLCEKVKNRDLTTEQAQIIFMKANKRLFGK
ncbi:MAG: serine protease [Sulfurimonas sp.]|uniref:S1 family peptidase n=1 Tax=Sulfurimonas sp. TaxID=2022749 RepID=UPI0025E8A994|nr:serine protease [Sulfurimonas sp.]MCK9490733.1 serine protease [Sulfurimonas sp.]